MAKKYTEQELNDCSKEILVTLFLHFQDQMYDQLESLNRKLDRMAEQMAVLQNKQYGRKSEKLDVIDGQLSFVFNEPEALVENVFVVEPAQEDVLETVTIKRKKKKGKREEDLCQTCRWNLSSTRCQKRNWQISSARMDGDPFRMKLF